MSVIQVVFDYALAQAGNVQVELIQPQSDAWDPLASLRSIDLWIVTRPLNAEVAAGLRSKMEQGATVLMTLPSTAMQDTLQTLWEDPSLEISEALVSDYALFGKIDFQYWCSFRASYSDYVGETSE